MTKLKSVLILSATAALLSATPAIAQYGSGTSAAKDAATDAAKDAAKDAADKAYGSGTKAADKVTDKAYGSGDKGAVTMQEKAYGSGDKGEVSMQEHSMKDSSHGSGTTAPAQGYNSGTTSTGIAPVSCPAGTKPSNDGTCLIVDSRLFGS